ncbi:MAG: YncE family protein [Planctomycetes bacterium]|nr:YncE family protein [Planctomycetota bacterium]
MSRFPAEPASATSPSDAPPHRSLRRPVALALADEGKWIFAANQRSGTVSVIDSVSLKVVTEVPVGRKVSDLAITADGNHLLAVDEEAGELAVFRRQGPRLESPVRVTVGPSPVSLRIAADGTRCVVALLWPRRLTVLPRQVSCSH